MSLLLSSIYFSRNMIGGKAARRNTNSFICFNFKTCLWIGFRAGLMGKIARMGAMRKSRKLPSTTGTLGIEVLMHIV